MIHYHNKALYQDHPRTIGEPPYQATPKQQRASTTTLTEGKGGVETLAFSLLLPPSWADSRRSLSRALQAGSYLGGGVKSCFLNLMMSGKASLVAGWGRRSETLLQALLKQICKPTGEGIKAVRFPNARGDLHACLHGARK